MVMYKEIYSTFFGLSNDVCFLLGYRKSREDISIRIQHLKRSYRYEYSIGKRGDDASQLVQGHIFDITHDNDTKVARHFNRHPPGTPSLVDGMIINVATFILAPPHTREAKILRDREEKRWMHRLQTITPLGLNLMD